MNIPAAIPAEQLPTLIDRAAQALMNARSSAEVLEARDMATVAYTAAKAAGRMARAKEAHDTVLSHVYRAQADALLIESRAKMRLADEYDAAQERGEAAKRGGDRRSDQSSQGEPLISPDDVGGKKALHEARRLRDAEKADPGVIERNVGEVIDRGDEPTRAELRRSLKAAVAEGARRPSNKNPHHVPDALRDAVIVFSGRCENIADQPDLAGLARWRGAEFTAKRARENAGKALRALQQFIDTFDSHEADNAQE